MSDVKDPQTAGRGSVAGSPLLHSIDAACHLLSMRRTWIYAQIKAGQIATVKLGRRTLIPDSALQGYIAKAMREAQA